MIDPKKIKLDFPVFERYPSLSYLDSAATSQKPRVVLERMVKFYEEESANVYKGVYELSEKATAAYANSRAMIAKFIGASSEEVVFTRNGTEACNLVAIGWAEKFLKAGDKVLVSALEHHSNYLPWQQVCKRKGAEFVVFPIDESSDIDYEKYEKLLDENVKLVAITQMSNVTGVMPDLSRIIDSAHRVGAKVMVDAVQGVSHLGIDVKKLDIDFAMFSGHKMFGPTGIGFLYGKKVLLNEMDPVFFGGGMVREVSSSHSTWAEIPFKFEAGTPAIAEAVALGTAIEYLSNFKFEEIIVHDRKLFNLAKSEFLKIGGVRVYGHSDSLRSGGILSFTIDGVHPHDIASIFDANGVAIRAGHHCAKPLIGDLGVNATARISFHIYNDEEDVMKAVNAINEVKKTFKV